MLDPHSVASLSRNGRVFCLVATPDEIFDRVVKDSRGSSVRSCRYRIRDSGSSNCSPNAAPTIAAAR